MKNKHAAIAIGLILLVIVGLGGCGNGGKEVVLAASEVGTPVGDAVNRTIGPEGGTLDSPDGRVTLVVPRNAVNAPVEFRVQPISNKAANGLGNAFRLEPKGTVFTTPVDVTIHYSDEDVRGTIPEACSLAY